MPLRDHYHPPLINNRSWEGFHGAWPAMMVRELNRSLPEAFVAEPRVKLGTFYDLDGASMPAEPMPAAAAEFPDQYEYEVLVYDAAHERRLVAAVEIVSPANKDRLAHRRLFVAKCATLLAQQVCVAIVDIVTTSHFNIYAEVLNLIGVADPSLSREPPHLYAVACRPRRTEERQCLEMWTHTLVLGQALPNLPLWFADNLAVPVELETSYEETCRILRID